MTIYAIVNDLLDSSLADDKAESVWTLMSPSSILQGGNPYFVPDLASRFEARTAVALRICKLGKGIAPRFAHRYVDAAAPAVAFAATDRLTRLRNAGMPWSSAISYDRSLAIGRFSPMSIEEAATRTCILTLDSTSTKVVIDRIPGSEGQTPKDIIAAISRDNTLKTGDIILAGLAGRGPEVTPGWKASLSLQGDEPLRFNIR